MKLGTYIKESDGFKIELVPGEVEYAVGTTEALMFTLRMGANDEGLILFLSIDEMQEFSKALRESVNDMRAQIINKAMKEAFGKEFEI